MDFSDNATKIILAIIAIFAGIAITVKIRKKNKKVDNSQNLNNVNAGGDVVLGDKKTNVNE